MPKQKPSAGASRSAISGTRRRRNPQKQEAKSQDLRPILRQLADHAEDPALLLELYYWSQEPGLANMIRAFVQLPEASQRILSAFMEIAKDDAQAVGVNVSARGDIVISAPSVSELFNRLVSGPPAPGQSKSLH